MAAKTVKMCDMDLSISIKVFEMLNRGNVRTGTGHLICGQLGLIDFRPKTTEPRYRFCGRVIITDVEPEDLIYPEGWYYAKGTFRNKHNSSDGRYWEAKVIKSNGDSWDDDDTKYRISYDH